MMHSFTALLLCILYSEKFDGKNFDESIVGFKGETLRDKGLYRENFDKSLAVHQICQNFPLSNLCAIQYVLLWPLASLLAIHT